MRLRIDFRENLPYDLALKFVKEAAKECGLGSKIISFKEQVKNNGPEAQRFYGKLFEGGWVSEDVIISNYLSKAKIFVTGIPREPNPVTGSVMLYGNLFFTKKQVKKYEHALTKLVEEHLGPTFRKNPILES